MGYCDAPIRLSRSLIFFWRCIREAIEAEEIVREPRLTCLLHKNTCMYFKYLIVMFLQAPCFGFVCDISFSFQCYSIILEALTINSCKLFKEIPVF